MKPSINLPDTVEKFEIVIESAEGNAFDNHVDFMNLTIVNVLATFADI